MKVTVSRGRRTWIDRTDDAFSTTSDPGSFQTGIFLSHAITACVKDVNDALKRELLPAEVLTQRDARDGTHCRGAITLVAYAVQGLLQFDVDR